MPGTLLLDDRFPPVPLRRKILGLTYADRFVFPARKQGCAASLFLSATFPDSVLGETVLLLSCSDLLSAAAWKKIDSQNVPEESVRFFRGPELCCLVRTRDAKALMALVRASASASDCARALEGRYKTDRVGLEARDFFAVRSESDVPALERWLLLGLIKDEEGFMSRHFERKISLSVTRALIDTGVTPNQMSLISVGIGVVGSFFFVPPGSRWHVTGALLFWLHSVLDGCDGEIARLKFLESRWGGILDFWGDNVVHAFVFAGIAWGLQRESVSLLPAGLGILAVSGSLLSAGFVFWQTMRPKKGDGPLFTSVAAPSAKPRGQLHKIADFLARRDFIYLVILLSYFGKIEWFLWMSAVGAPVYFGVLLFFSLKNKWS